MIRTSTSSKSDLHFDYDAMGNRICKIVKPRDPAIGLSDQNAWTYTYYLRDAQGNVIATYDRDFTSPATYYYDQLTVKENHLYGSSRVGVKSDTLRIASVKYNYTSTSNHVYSGTVNSRTSVAAQTNAFVHALGRRSYELANHLGNVLVTVSDARTATNGVGSQSGTVVSFNAVVNSATDYYAFGSPMEGRSYSSASYRYGFNGKENDPEAVGTGEGLQDYGMRIYNPGLGRFLSVDPYARNYASLTSYQFASNSPINSIDMDGLEKYTIIYEHDANGNVTRMFLQVLTNKDIDPNGNPNAAIDKSGLGPNSNFAVVHHYPNKPPTTDYYSSRQKLKPEEQALFNKQLKKKGTANLNSTIGHAVDIWEADASSPQSAAPQPTNPDPGPSGGPVVNTAPAPPPANANQIDVGYDLSTGDADPNQYSTNPYARSNKEVYFEILDRANTQEPKVIEIHIGFGYARDGKYTLEQQANMRKIIQQMEKEVTDSFQGNPQPKIIKDTPSGDWHEHAYVELKTK